MPDSHKDFYAVLGVDHKTSADEIKKAYLKLAVKWHPDKFPANTDAESAAKKQAEEKFKDITQAYSTLKDEKARRDYDLSLSAPHGAFKKAAAVKTDIEKLHYAVKHHNAKSVNALLKAGVQPDEQALRLAVEEKWSSCAKTFMNMGVKPTFDMFHTAIRNKDTDTVNLFLDAGLEPDQRSLTLAVQQQWADGVEAFLSGGVKPAPEMLDIAAHNGDADTANLLLDYGAVPDQKTISFVMQQGWIDWQEAFRDARKHAEKQPLWKFGFHKKKPGL